MSPALKVALAHDWLNGMRGGEKCLEVFCELFPDSPIHTLFYEKGKLSDKITSHPIRTSPLQGFPSVYTKYRYYLPFYTACAETFRLKKFDLLISTSHCVAKGIPKNKEAYHICYCFTPARYAWGFFNEYFGGMNPLAKMFVSWTLNGFREWDLRNNQRVDHFVAISEHIRKRIQLHYRRDSEVIYPPVDTTFYVPDMRIAREDYYLVISALVPYKRIDVAVQAFNRSGKKLVIIGDGPQKSKLQKMAKSNVQFLGWLPDEGLRDHYRRAKALLFPGEEDFGIVPVEAQACGCPVIAYAKGGALETVLNGETGVFFNECNERSLTEAVSRFESKALDPEAARRNAERFSTHRFEMEIKSMIQRQLAKRKAA